jgi:hypothetical protein
VCQLVKVTIKDVPVILQLLLLQLLLLLLLLEHHLLLLLLLEEQQPRIHAAALGAGRRCSCGCSCHGHRVRPVCMHRQRRHHPAHTSKASASSRCTAKAQLGARVTAHVA